jgi:hypothetical protein
MLTQTGMTYTIAAGKSFNMVLYPRRPFGSKYLESRERHLGHKGIDGTLN